MFSLKKPDRRRVAKIISKADEKEDEKTALKSETTAIVSRFFYAACSSASTATSASVKNRKPKQHIDCKWMPPGMLVVKSIVDQLKLNNVSENLIIKGGLQFFLQMKELVALIPDCTTRQRTYIESIFQPSDLDSSIMLPDAFLKDTNRIKVVKDIIIDCMKFHAGHLNMNLGLLNHLNTRLSTKNNSALCAKLGVQKIKFSISKQNNFEINEDPSDAKFIFINTNTGDRSPFYVSKISNIKSDDAAFAKSHFDLFRIKLQVRAAVTDVDGVVRHVQCPAEIVDVSIPLLEDTLRKEYFSKVSSALIREILISSGTESIDIKIGNSLKHALHNLHYTLYEYTGNCPTSDRKFKKRMRRFLILLHFHKLLYPLSKANYNVEIASNCNDRNIIFGFVKQIKDEIEELFPQIDANACQDIRDTLW